VKVIKSKLIDLGALGASMTGTGSAVYGLFDSQDAARSAYDALKTQYRECLLAVTTEKLGLN
jgi:4-diphosphocytidyl-2-C-methyl-D-erythritol kinase